MEVPSQSPDILAAVLVRSTILLFVVLAISFAVRRRSAAIQHGVWAVGLAGCLAMPLVVAVSTDLVAQVASQGTWHPNNID